VSIGVAGRPLGAASFRAATNAFIAVLCWQPLFGAVMIGAEDGRSSKTSLGKSVD
jgi:hypothetical protein